MTAPEIPREVVQFLVEHVESVIQLEVLLLLQSRPSSLHDAKEISRELRIDTDWTESELAKLARSGLLAPAGQAYRFAPRTPQLAQTIATLADCYAQRRVSVISLIFSKPDAIRQFTDAFRFRKDEPS